jgi:hypothetical protein
VSISKSQTAANIKISQTITIRDHLLSHIFPERLIYLFHCFINFRNQANKTASTAMVATAIPQEQPLHSEKNICHQASSFSGTKMKIAWDVAQAVGQVIKKLHIIHNI